MVIKFSANMQVYQWTYHAPTKVVKWLVIYPTNLTVTGVQSVGEFWDASGKIYVLLENCGSTTSGHLCRASGSPKILAISASSSCCIYFCRSYSCIMEGGKDLLNILFYACKWASVALTNLVINQIGKTSITNRLARTAKK